MITAVLTNVKVNDQEVWVSAAKGRFTARPFELGMGENEIHVAAADVHGNSETHQNFTVVRPGSRIRSRLPNPDLDRVPTTLFLECASTQRRVQIRSP